jgi:sucrose-6-phosphate hydrolase SacC (GH32 family)
MSILSTVKKGYLYMKTSTGYLKLLPRTLASLVSLDNGNSVETEISNIKSAASSLSTTVSGHTTKLNGLKTGSTSTVANNLTTTTSGYVLDARMGKSLQDSITTLNSTFSYETGTMGLLRPCNGCTGTEGHYIKVGKLVTFNVTIYLEVSEVDMPTTYLEIPCLPYKTKDNCTFSSGYQNCCLKSNDDNWTITKVGANYSTQSILFYVSQDARTWTAMVNDIKSEGKVVVSGSYIIE